MYTNLLGEGLGGDLLSSQIRDIALCLNVCLVATSVYMLIKGCFRHNEAGCLPRTHCCRLCDCRN